jgi:hypothetical protein
VIDIGGGGLHLTSAADGVLFKLNLDPKLEWAWTQGSTNAWLALPDENGLVLSGKQLISNVMTLPDGTNAPNAFEALAAYDNPLNGGNGDGVIDAKDAIFSKLRLWIDANHDGLSESSELFTLPELGISAIHLDYKADGKQDQYGNTFRYRAKVDRADHTDGPQAYDVYLTFRPVAPVTTQVNKVPFSRR